MSRGVWLGIVLLAGMRVLAQSTPPSAPPVPANVDEFQAAALQVIQEHGVPGAGIALVRADRVEWAGGVGHADRDRRTPVTADMHFRAGSISKTFVAMSLVQLSEDGLLDLDAPVAEVAPEVRIDNPWHDTDPVRVIHLLEHTAGFDDMHYSERINDTDGPDLPLIDVLGISPGSRRVRWRPATRMSYSSPGYAVAGFVIEKISGAPFEDYIEREILEPLKMHTSSFRLAAGDEAMLARGYDAADGAAVANRRIVLRPARSLHTSPREMARFIQMLLNWGELDGAAVIDPEYLGTMQYPQTTLAARAGLRNGYGSGLFMIPIAGYPMLGHDGGVEGYTSVFGYSPSRDAGFAVFLNSSGPGAGGAMNDLASLAVSFLKRDVLAPAPAAAVTLPQDVLDRYVGFYQDANPRSQIVWPLTFLSSGRTVTRDGNVLVVERPTADSAKLIPVSETMFRRENEVEPSVVFTTSEEGTLVMTGSQVYAERRPRWRTEIVRVPLVAAATFMISPFAIAPIWLARMRRARPRAFWELKAAMVACPIALLAPFAALGLVSIDQWGTRNAATITVLLASLALPILAVLVVVLAIGARREGASRWLVAYAWQLALAVGGVSWYFAAHRLVGLRMWDY